jgi:CDP-diacylglycerol--glycerol-3-phosphate 3-phosphatidyltransferase
LGEAAFVADWVNIVTMTAAVVLTVASGIDYIVAFVRPQSNEDDSDD